MSETNSNLQIAIDGPASAGKSTVAKLVAKKLNYIYCDTGAMYRVATYCGLHAGLDLSDDQAFEKMLKDLKLEFIPQDPVQRVLVNGQDVTEAIRMPDVTNNVSQVAALPSVRNTMTSLQREIASRGGIVMDGRDIGTTVLPAAQVKIFMVASVKERALRRFKENQEKGINIPLAELEKAIAERDLKDVTRAISPLVKADDAIELDTTSLSIEEVVAAIMETVAKAQ